MSEKATQQILPALHEVGGAACSKGQNVNIKGGIVREGIGFQIDPQILDGIEFGRIGRQILQVCRTRHHALLDELTLVSLQAIPEEHDGRVQLTVQMLEESHGALSVDVGIWMQQKVQRDPATLWQDAQRGDDRDLVLGATAPAQQRRVSAHAPRAAHQGAMSIPDSSMKTMVALRGAALFLPVAVLLDPGTDALLIAPPRICGFRSHQYILLGL